jgi:hypothetical protein
MFDKMSTWRLHIDMIEAKIFRTFIRIYSLLKSERWRANIKLTLHNALITSVIPSACPAWVLAADTYLVKLKRLQIKVLCAIGNFPRCTLVRDFAHGFQPSVCIYLSMARQPFVGTWLLFQFADHLHSRYDQLDVGSAHRKAATCTQDDTNTE